MPRKRRREVIDESQVGAYHVWSRTVRRAYLVGRDRRRGRDYRHRQEWIRLRLLLLVQVFAVECLDYAVLENHFHAILRNRPDLVRGWSDAEVARRWLRLNQAALELLAEPTAEQVMEFLEQPQAVLAARKRLSSISWFMAALKEPIARMANCEDGVTGHFWAERFGAERLPDDPALLVCSLYVNLNPLRAGIADRPERAPYTSVCERIRDRVAGDGHLPRCGWLAPVHVDGDGYDGVAAGRRPSNKGYLWLSDREYLELLDVVWRREQAAAAGREEACYPPVLERLGVEAWAWETHVRRTSRRFSRELEREQQLRNEAGL